MVRLARLVVLDEEYFVWEEGRRMAFRTVSISHPVLSGWAEDFRLDRTREGGCQLTWTMALDSPLLQRVSLPRVLPRAVEFCQRKMAGIQTILPPPQPIPLAA